MANINIIMPTIMSVIFGFVFLWMSNIFNIIRFYILRNCSAEGEIIRHDTTDNYLYRSVVKFKIGDKEIIAQSEQMAMKAETIKVGTFVNVRFRLSNPEKTALFDVPLRFNLISFIVGIAFLTTAINIAIGNIVID